MLVPLPLSWLRALADRPWFAGPPMASAQSRSSCRPWPLRDCSSATTSRCRMLGSRMGSCSLVHRSPRRRVRCSCTRARTVSGSTRSRSRLRSTPQARSSAPRRSSSRARWWWLRRSPTISLGSMQGRSTCSSGPDSAGRSRPSSCPPLRRWGWALARNRTWCWPIHSFSPVPRASAMSRTACRPSREASSCSSAPE